MNLIKLLGATTVSSNCILLSTALSELCCL
jgi:hypothetical protein